MVERRLIKLSAKIISFEDAVKKKNEPYNNAKIRLECLKYDTEILDVNEIMDSMSEYMSAAFDGIDVEDIISREKDEKKYFEKRYKAFIKFMPKETISRIGYIASQMLTMIPNVFEDIENGANEYFWDYTYIYSEYMSDCWSDLLEIYEDIDYNPTFPITENYDSLKKIIVGILEDIVHSTIDNTPNTYDKLLLLMWQLCEAEEDLMSKTVSIDST